MVPGPSKTLAADVAFALSFEEFFEAEYLRLARALYLSTGDRLEGEDLAQEALARVYERWDRVRMMESPIGYAYRTALNVHRKRQRSLRRRKAVSASTSVADTAETVERREAIRQAIDSLSPSQRDALVLVEFLGLGSGEAAKVLGITPDSVRARIHRARTVLRERFGGSDA